MSHPIFSLSISVTRIDWAWAIVLRSVLSSTNGGTAEVWGLDSVDFHGSSWMFQSHHIIMCQKNRSVKFDDLMGRFAKTQHSGTKSRPCSPRKQWHKIQRSLIWFTRLPPKILFHPLFLSIFGSFSFQQRITPPTDPWLKIPTVWLLEYRRGSSTAFCTMNTSNTLDLPSTSHHQEYYSFSRESLSTVILPLLLGGVDPTNTYFLPIQFERNPWCCKVTCPGRRHWFALMPWYMFPRPGDGWRKGGPEKHGHLCTMAEIEIKVPAELVNDCIICWKCVSIQCGVCVTRY